VSLVVLTLKLTAAAAPPLAANSVPEVVHVIERTLPAAAAALNFTLRIFVLVISVAPLPAATTATAAPSCFAAQVRVVAAAV